MTHKNIQGIQVLRGIAALLVVFHHARASVPHTQGWPESGAAGVDIFFVISGFVMAHATRKMGEVGPMQRLRDALGFLAKRVVRVVPLYWLALLWTSRRELSKGLFDTGLVKDFFFIPRFNPVYPDMLWPSVIQGWTLNYEMFFYALFGASLLVGKPRFKVLIAALLVLIAVGFSPLAIEASNLTGTVGVVDIALRFYTNNILLEFIFGIVLQRILTTAHPPHWPKSVYGVLMLLGFVGLIVGFGHEPRGLLVGIPALVIVWASIPVFSGRPLPKWQAIGDASYAIYLFHWASFGAVNPVATKIETLAVGVPPWLLAPMVVMFYMLFAVISGLVIHRWLERPLMRGMETWFRPRSMGVTP